MAIVRTLLCLFTLFLGAGFAVAAERAIIVLDASGSMWGQINGKPKLEIARETLATVLKSIPADMELGLMAYGHREKGSCEDIELIVPPATGTAEAIIAAAEKMKFLGKTPLSAAVRKAAEDLRYTEEKSTVILITDGLETCSADPCALARELEQGGIDFTAHVVGFGLSEEEGKQVACLADETGGKYLPAADAGELANALETVVNAEPTPVEEPAAAPQPEVTFNLAPTATLSEGAATLGKEDDVTWEVYQANADGSRGEHVTTDYRGGWKGNLEPGDYVVVAKRDHAQSEQKVTIEAGKVAEPYFVLNAGTLVIRARASEGEGLAEGASINVLYPGDGNTTYYGQMKAVFPAGEQTVTVKLGEGQVTETITLKAGETIEKDIVVGVGKLTVNAFYTAGMKVDASGLAIRILRAAKKIDGTREDVTYAYGPDAKFDLSPGDYAVIAKMDEAEAESIVSVRSGELTEASVLLNAGVLAVSAPGAKKIAIFAAQKDIQGNRKEFGFGYAETHQATLPAGDFVAVATRGDEDKQTEVPVTVKAGERTEASIP